MHRIAPVFDKLPIWVSYFFAILCSVGMGYSLGSARSGTLGLQPDQIRLIAIAAAALFAIVLLDLKHRTDEKRRAEQAEQLRLNKEAAAAQLVDPVDNAVIEALDRIATAKGVDRATLIPAILKQYIARKSYEDAFPERAKRPRANASSESSAEWLTTVPAWWETLPGSLDVNRRPTHY